jgi:aconitate hydratase A / 2-methylisocitrate dehydratase
MNSFGAETTLDLDGQEFRYFSLEALAKSGHSGVSSLPFSLRIMIENLLRHEDETSVSAEDILAVLGSVGRKPEREIAFRPARVLMQDFTGVPAVVDLATMREVVAELGGSPDQINPLQPVDLVIDHSVQIDRFGTVSAFSYNAERELERNVERYRFLKWGQSAFRNFRVVPPDTGIVHQVNLEYLAHVVFLDTSGKPQLYPDTLVGTDSHTTMVNGMGVVGWGVGGIEAEGAMLGCPISMLIPEVVGFRLVGQLPEGATATDAVLRVTEMLRARGVVGKFVEFYGAGVSNLSLADRATISNMSPEYGATIGFFPVDEETLSYMRLTGRSEDAIRRVDAYCRAQGLFRTPDTPDPEFGDTIELDLGTIEPSIAGPRRPQDRIGLGNSQVAFRKTLVSMLDRDGGKGPGADISTWMSEGGRPQTASNDPAPEELAPIVASVPVKLGSSRFEIGHGSVVIAAITSCTNTSNPSVMVAAGLLARNAVERGLDVRPWVKTSLAPGSRVVTDYLRDTGLLQYLEALRFHLVGYGCTTCIGNSGPLPEPIAEGVRENELVVTSVLSGNRNFEGRINPLVRANYLASPPLVVAYAIAGNMDIDLIRDPVGYDPNGEPVYLREIWPTGEEVRTMIASAVRPEMFRKAYEESLQGDERWKNLDVPSGELYNWDEASTYVKKPPFFEGMGRDPAPLRDILGARALAVLGDSVTTDHISPAGAIPQKSPTADYLRSHDVASNDFNSYGSRRGNHEVMMRGTFGNIRLRNLLVPGTEGSWTLHLPDEEKMFIYDAAMRYQSENVPLVVVAGKEYGSGSSRDWAAKGTRLLGVRAVLAESYERIHRSNLIGMGVLPLEFPGGQNRESLDLTGTEEFDITGIAEGLTPGQELNVRARGSAGEKEFRVRARIDTPVEVEYYRNGGILQYVLRQMTS